MGKEEKRKLGKHNDKTECSLETNNGRIHGTFATQAVTDTTDKFDETNAPNPSDENVEQGRDWVNHNKK
ncbi:MAG: hypothetical protein PHH84_02710 [Oscillospiraceae bacterium]|nr:hypothetical protein [Oscillospiraceae bacterium]MDD4414642.1 hypothetical protein [Oscillospiraceae bacterium]